MKYTKGNALDWASKDGYCMIHVCNNKGGFGGGRTALATQVRTKFPEVYSSYMKHYTEEGTACGCSDSVVNLIAQDGYGPRRLGIKYFNDDWFEASLKDLYDNNSSHTIVVPYLMGADRAGGDWSWIIGKVEEILGDKFEILVVKYNSD